MLVELLALLVEVVETEGEVRLRFAQVRSRVKPSGAPDQGTEGIRFMGYTLYDPLVMWDLSSATEPAKLVPGLPGKKPDDMPPAMTGMGGGPSATCVAR